MNRKFVIVSLKHSTKDCIVFWMANNSGYTSNPFLAGVYDEETVKGNLGYYSDNSNVPVIISGDFGGKELSHAGIKISVNPNKIYEYQKMINKMLS